MRRFTCFTLLVIGLASGSWACSNTTPITNPVNPSNTTETFSGTLTPNGAQTFPFTVASAGTVTATLSAVTPDATTQIGLSLGTWNGSACQAIISNDKAVQGTSVTGAATIATSLCARVYDVGNLTGDESIPITVVHP